MYYWGFWSANHSRGHIWAVFSLEEHTALWLVRSYSHRCTPGHLWGNWEITWWKGASLTSIMNEIETCKDQTGPQHIPSSILAGCWPDIHVFWLKIESPIFFHAQGGRHSWLWISQSSWLDYQRAPKNDLNGHMQVLWLQYGETVWNKGDGTSQGTTGVVLCNSFVGQRGPSRGIKGHTKGPMRPKMFFFGHKWVCRFHTVEQYGIRVEQVIAH